MAKPQVEKRPLKRGKKSFEKLGALEAEFTVNVQGLIQNKKNKGKYEVWLVEKGNNDPKYDNLKNGLEKSKFRSESMSTKRYSTALSTSRSVQMAPPTGPTSHYS